MINPDTFEENNANCPLYDDNLCRLIGVCSYMKCPLVYWIDVHEARHEEGMSE